MELAAEAGLSAVALTDHDNLAGLEEASRRAAELGITFVPGCEVSCEFAPGTMHVLCYFIADEPGALQSELARQRVDRETRNDQLLDRLGELGIALDAAEVAEQAGSEVIGRPHFAALLVRHGYVGTIQEAFDRFLAKGAAAYVDKEEIEVDRIIQLVHAAGGVAVLAHPLSLGVERHELATRLGELRELGLTGLECYYSRYSPELRSELVDLTRRSGLVATGGSDFHGSYKPDLSVGSGTGDLQVPDAVLQELLARRPGRDAQAALT